MESQAAKVIPWSGKVAHSREPEPVVAPEPRLGPIEDVLIIVGDEQLEALAAMFHLSPARKAMTFEAYLTVKGFAREVV